MIMELIIRKFKSSMRSYNDTRLWKVYSTHQELWNRELLLMPKMEIHIDFLPCLGQLKRKLCLILWYEPDCEFESVQMKKSVQDQKIRKLGS